MTSDEDIEKLKEDILWKIGIEDFEIFASILKELQELKQIVSFGGRQIGKGVTSLNLVLHKSIDKPILWLGDDVFGSKYIVPQKQFEEMQKDLKRLAKYEEILKDRLTKKIENPQFSNDYELICAHSYHAVNKLGKLEDIYSKENITLEVKDDNSQKQVENQKTDPNDDQADVVEYFKKNIAREYFFPHKNNNPVKEFQRKLLEMISIRQQEAIGRMTNDKAELYMGVLKAYKNIFELVLNFYRDENKNRE